MLKLHNWKTRFGISDSAFSDLLTYVGSFLPKDHVLPHNAYEAKKTLSDLGLDYIKFHAYPNECVLYKGEIVNGLTIRYCCWPVVLETYNLHSWLCLKRKFMMLTILVYVPHEPGNNIDIFLQSLIDDLKKLWEEGEPNTTRNMPSDNTD